MRTPIIVKTAVLIALCAAIAAHAVKYVAVVETEVDAQSGASAAMNPAEVRQITAELRRQAAENLPRDKYNVMTSETVQSMGGAVLEECADENCVITLGSKIGADYIVRGTISKFQTRFTLTAELYETENGTLVVASEPVRSENLGELLDKASAACANMYKKFADTHGASAPVSVALPPPERQYAEETQAARAAAVSSAVSNPAVERNYDYYFAPKYVADVPNMLVGGEVEVGWVWGKGAFFGGVFGFSSYGSRREEGVYQANLSEDQPCFSSTDKGESTGDDCYGDVMWLGGGITLGNAVNLGNQLQLLYGVTAGFWFFDGEIFNYDSGPNKDKSDDRTAVSFLGPIVKLRRNFIELTYRGLLGISGAKLNGSYDIEKQLFYWNNQIMIGLHFETSKRKK